MYWGSHQHYFVEHCGLFTAFSGFHVSPNRAPPRDGRRVGWVFNSRFRFCPSFGGRKTLVSVKFHVNDIVWLLLLFHLPLHHAHTLRCRIASLSLCIHALVVFWWLRVVLVVIRKIIHFCLACTHRGVLLHREQSTFIGGEMTSARPFSWVATLLANVLTKHCINDNQTNETIKCFSWVNVLKDSTQFIAIHENIILQSECVN